MSDPIYLLLAQKKFGDSRTVQSLALATDITIDLLTNPVLGSAKLATNSAGVALKNGVPAVLQIPRATNLMKEFLIQAPKTFTVVSQSGRYASGGSAAYTINEKFTEVVNSIKFY